MKDQYCSKIILFGEYSMIFDATALLVPFRRFSARWVQAADNMDEQQSFSARELLRFCAFLQENGAFAETIDTDAFAEGLRAGWVLASDVPPGYGLGSSGTVAAAVYDRYGKAHLQDPVQLKELFGRMESFFHGSSSGIDPLLCWLGRPFRISADRVELLDDDILNRGIRICLIDTKKERETKPLVEYFKKQLEDPAFAAGFRDDYLPWVSACINALVQGDHDAFFTALRHLSAGQLRFFRPMIPDHTAALFRGGNDFNFGVKILGAGGGGYMLGFTDDCRKAAELLKDYDVLWLEPEQINCGGGEHAD